MSGPTPLLGIDFGTTNSSAAWVDARARLHVVPISELDQHMPSVVWVGPQGQVEVGADARQRLVTDPANVVFGLKRFLGRLFKSDFVGRYKDRFPYKLVEDDLGTAGVELHGVVRSLRELAGVIIRRVVDHANASSGLTFTECVLTVPAHYGYRQRQAMRLAANQAGLNVRALVNEPTAAALAYVKQFTATHPALVFDMGGGTFDATLIAIEGHRVRVLATGGDAFLGGMDFDERMAQALAQRFEAQHGVSISGNREVMRRLMFACETAKMQLSLVDETEVRVLLAAQVEGRSVDLNYVLTRADMDGMVAPLIERSLGACETLLARTGGSAKDISELIMVGGMTRMLALRKRLGDLFKVHPNKAMHPELAVCSGAAHLGRALSMPAGSALVDVLSVPLWVMFPNGAGVPLVPANTPVPHTLELTLAAMPPVDGPLHLLVYEALDATSVEREVLASVKIEPDWLRAHRGVQLLRARITESFALELVAVAHDGAQLPLHLDPVRIT